MSESGEYLEQLRKFYVKVVGGTAAATLVSLGVGFMLETAILTDKAAYGVLVGLMVLAIIVVGGTSMKIRSAGSGMREGADEETHRKYRGAYIVRVVGLGGMMLASGIAFLLTRLDQGLYLSGIFLLLLLLTYPTQMYVYKS